MRQDTDKTANGRRDESSSSHSTGRRYTVHEAALLLGLSVDVPSARGPSAAPCGGRRTRTARSTSFLDADQTPTGPTGQQPEDDRTSDSTERVEDLKEHIAYLRLQLDEEREARRRADTILAQLSAANAEQARTIRAIEAPASPEPRNGHETPTEGPDGWGRPSPGYRRDSGGGRAPPLLVA